MNCIHCKLAIHFDQGETRHVDSGSIFCKKKRGMTLMEAEPKLEPKVGESGLGDEQPSHPKATGVMCMCCGHESFKNGGTVLCDYCFLKRLQDSKHECKLPSVAPQGGEEGDLRPLRECPWCGLGQPDSHVCAVEKEQGRWQKAIYELLVKATDDSIDGGGCDSGDPLDFTLAEISQALGILKEKSESVAPPSLPTQESKGFSYVGECMDCGGSWGIKDTVAGCPSCSITKYRVHVRVTPWGEYWKNKESTSRAAVPVAPLSEQERCEECNSLLRHQRWYTNDGRDLCANTWHVTGEGSELPASHETPPCPICSAPIFVRPNGSIVAHYKGDGRKCAANEIFYKPQERGNETGPVRELLNSMKVVDRYQRRQECRSEVLTNLMYELIELRQLKSAISSPQQESAEFTEAKRLLIEAREMRNLFVRADQNHGSKSADKMSDKADEIFYRILEFNKRVAPPVTAKGTNEK